MRSLDCVRVLRDWLADGLWTVVEEGRDVLDWSALTAPGPSDVAGSVEFPNDGAREN